MELELEIKVLNMDIKELEKKVISLGGVLVGEENQVNTQIDSYTKPIASYLDAYLRIRETKDLMNGDKDLSTLTLKKNVLSNGIRKSEEYNVDIGNRNTMLQIFKELGLDKIEMGYKHRKSYMLEDIRFDFDTWDVNTYPDPYMEIEVKRPQDLKTIIKLLNIPQENISTKSINELRKLDKITMRLQDLNETIRLLRNQRDKHTSKDNLDANVAYGAAISAMNKEIYNLETLINQS